MDTHDSPLQKPQGFRRNYFLTLYTSIKALQDYNIQSFKYESAIGQCPNKLSGQR